jgi:hypothetical protein
MFSLCSLWYTGCVIKEIMKGLEIGDSGSMGENIPLERVDANRWRIPQRYNAEMRVPGMVLADDELIRQIIGDNALQQVANVATLPGIVGYSLAMPDIHWGYGFPVGGVAATDAEYGTVSPGWQSLWCASNRSSW